MFRKMVVSPWYATTAISRVGFDEVLRTSYGAEMRVCFTGS
jgi:hypothetical protein